MSRTYSFEDTRGGITNTQSVTIHEEPLKSPAGATHISLTIDLVEDLNNPDKFSTDVEAHGFEDINELAEHLIQIGHQIGHDLGRQCHIKPILGAETAAATVQGIELPQEAVDAITAALGSLLKTNDQQSNEEN